MTKNEGDPLPEKEPVPWNSAEEDTFFRSETYEYSPGVDNPGFVGDNRPRPGNETSTEVPEVPEVVIDAASSAEGEIKEEGKKFSGINAGKLCTSIYVECFYTIVLPCDSLGLFILRYDMYS